MLDVWNDITEALKEPGSYWVRDDNMHISEPLTHRNPIVIGKKYCKKNTLGQAKDTDQFASNQVTANCSWSAVESQTTAGLRKRAWRIHGGISALVSLP